MFGNWEELLPKTESLENEKIDKLKLKFALMKKIMIVLNS